MKIIIDFPDDIKPKHYSNIMEQCGAMIREPKSWKHNCTGVFINDEPYLIECRKQKNINFTISSKSREFIKIKKEELNEKWEVEKCNV